MKLTPAVSTLHYLPVIGKSSVLQTFDIFLHAVRPTLSEVGTLGFIAEKEADDKFAIELSL